MLPRLSEGGLIAIDNTLWSGKVLDPPDETTKLIAALNDKLATDDRVVVVQLTVRDGVTAAADCLRGHVRGRRRRLDEHSALKRCALNVGSRHVRKGQ